MHENIIYTEALLPDRPIAFNRDFVNLKIGVTGAIFLSQSVYWTKSDAAKKRGGWFYKTAKDWTKETGLTEQEQRTIKNKLKSLGYVEIKKEGIPARNYFKINADKIIKDLIKISEQVLLNQQLQCCEINSTGSVNFTEHSYTENTTETTTDIICESEDSQSIVKVMEVFKEVSPSMKYGNKTERRACSEMIAKWGLEETLRIVNLSLKVMQSDQYCPRAATPHKFWSKIGEIKIYFDSKKTSNQSINSVTHL